MTAITVDFESGPFVVAITEQEAIEAILRGHHEGAYRLPTPVLRAAEGATAVVARAAAVHAELSAAETALAEGAGRLVATIVRESATSGTLSKTDAGGSMVELEAAVAKLRHEAAIFFVTSEKIEPYPAVIVRSISGDVLAALDAGLASLCADARPHAAKVAAVDPAGRNPLAAAMRLDPTGTDALEGLSGRLLALELAAGAMARLDRPWHGLDGAPAGEPVIRLARMAVGG